MDDIELLKSAQLYQTDPETGKSGITLAGILLLGNDRLFLSAVPHLLLVLGNPARQSVANGMFFSFEGNGTEHRFWKSILKNSGILELSYDKNLPVDQLNKIRKEQLLDLAYDSPFRIGLCVFITFPSAPGSPWGGVAGVQKLIGIRTLRKLEQEEGERVFQLAEEFLNKKGAAIAFQENAWNSLRSEKDAEYSIGDARTGKFDWISQVCKLTLTATGAGIFSMSESNRFLPMRTKTPGNCHAISPLIPSAQKKRNCNLT